MRLRTISVLVVLILIAGFLWLNWPAITAVAKFDLVLATIEAPVGLVMLAIIGLIVATFTIYLVVSQGAMLLEARRSGRELQAQKAVAERAETSRYIELRELIQAEFARLGERLIEVQGEMRRDIQNGENSIAATIAELDDRLQSPRGGDRA